MYVSASRDGGPTWPILPGRHTDRRSAPRATAIAWAGLAPAAAWIDEEIELTPLAGTEALLRLEYVTDQGYNARATPSGNQVLTDSASPEPGATRGAVDYRRLGAPRCPVPQRWELRLVQWLPTKVIVDPVVSAWTGRPSSRWTRRHAQLAGRRPQRPPNPRARSVTPSPLTDPTPPPPP